jgi:hypothetical protein
VSQVLLHDSGRSGKVSWAESAIQNGIAAGVVISPWQTPPIDLPRRPSAVSYRDRVLAGGGTVVWDPYTWGSLAPGANARSMYDRWSLWNGQGNPRLVDSALLDHVDRCVTHAQALGVHMLAPSLRLDSPQGQPAQRTLDMAERALGSLPGTGVSIAGSPAFWTGGNPLDAFIGELISLGPGRVNVMMVRPGGTYPPAGISADEIEGVCRSVHSLSLHAPVTVGHGDFAALPAIVAGATLIGSGWDLGQRVCSVAAFQLSSGGGGGTPPRVTHGGLLGVLKRVEAEALLAVDPPRSKALVPGGLPIGLNGAWKHHLECLTTAVGLVANGPTRSARARILEGLYTAAHAQFLAVDGLVGGLATTGADWIDPIMNGFNQYVHNEGL